MGFGCLATRCKSLALLFLFTSALLAPAEAQVVIRVPQDQSGVQAAIDAAANGDTVLVAAGIYVENINFNGKAITVRSESGPSVTVIDGNNADPVAKFVNGEGAASVLQGFTLRNGAATVILGAGGIYVQWASPSIIGNIIASNRGCGIASETGSPLIQGNVITGNTPAIACAGISGSGGGLGFLGSPGQILNNVISGNAGSGISLFGSSARITGNFITDNSTSQGGGIWMVNSSNAAIIQNVIAGNQADTGGGIYSLAQAPLLVNNTIADNDSPQGSAFFFAGGYVRVFNNTLVAKPGQTALYCDGLYDPSSPIIEFNNVYAPFGTASDGICSNLAGTNGNISADPLFEDQANRNFRLLNGSPVIDSGTNSVAGLATKDIDENVRLFDGDRNGIARVDLGAYEFTAPPRSIGALPAGHQFGEYLAGASPASVTVTILNSGTIARALSFITVASNKPALFGVTPGGPNPCNSLSPIVAAGGSCTLVVTFTPSAAGIVSGQLFAMSDTLAPVPMTSFTATVIAIDATPERFEFTGQSTALLNSAVSSNAITVAGINGPAPISVTGGEYSINGGAFVDGPGKVGNGDSVMVRVTSPSSYGATATATLTIGGVSAPFSVTTPASWAAAGYLPLPEYASWSYLRDVVPYTTTILPDTTIFGGAIVRQAQDSDDGVINYYTNDTGGILEHGGYTPSVFISDYGYTTATIQLVAPLKLMDAHFSLGQSFVSGGNALFNYAGIGTVSFSYLSTSSPIAFETVTGPAGTFNALRVDRSLRIYGPVGSNTMDTTVQGSEWYVDGLGRIKSVMTTNDGTETSTSNEVLTASSLLDASPDPFAFSSLTHVGPGAPITSNAIAVQGINVGVDISIINGEYSIDGGAWTSSAGMVFSGQSVSLRQTASAAYGITTSATLTIGGVSAPFTVTTAPPDPIPDAFSFVPVVNAALNSPYAANVITVSGINTVAPIGIAGGSYSINGAAYTSAAGTVSNGQTVSVLLTSAGTHGTQSCAALTIGGVLGQFCVTTAPTVPGAPTSVTAAAGNASATVSFIAPSSNGGAAITNYTVTSSPGGIAAAGTSSPITVTGLTNGTAYTFTVAATNSVGSGPASAASNVVRPSPPDTIAPSAPSELAASAVSSSQIDLSWTAATDNVGLTAYRVYRNGVLIRTLGNVTSYSNTGLLASTSYSFTVAGCDAAGNCSGQSAPASATTLAAAPGSTNFTPQILAKWNLLGNTGTVALDVTALFGTQDGPIAGVSEYMLSVWKWVVNPETGTGKWAFFTPSLTKAESDAAALALGYDALSTIDPGEGFWVNRTLPPNTAVTLNGPAGEPFYHDAVSFGALKKNSWHLIATDSSVEPSVFNSSDLNATPPTVGTVPTENFRTLWAWSAPLQKWYFYATVIEANGYTSATGTVYTGLDAVRQAAVDGGYLDFHTQGRTLGSGVGFWVRR